METRYKKEQKSGNKIKITTLKSWTDFLNKLVYSTIRIILHNIWEYVSRLATLHVKHLTGLAPSPARHKNPSGAYVEGEGQVIWDKALP